MMRATGHAHMVILAYLRLITNRQRIAARAAPGPSHLVLVDVLSNQLDARARAAGYSDRTPSGRAQRERAKCSFAQRERNAVLLA